MTTTRKDVEYMFGEYADLIEKAGLLRLAHRLELTVGSPSAGRPWQIHETFADPSDGTCQRQPLVGDSVLGATASQAWEALWQRRRVVLDVLALQQRRQDGFSA